MKVCHVSSSDRQGGAAIAANRLCGALRSQDVDSFMLVRRLTQPPPDWVTAYRPDKALAKTAARALRGWQINLQNLDVRPQPAYEGFSDPRSRYGVQLIDDLPQHDVMHLHWVTQFIDLPALCERAQAPVVWTLHDMNLLTGGCHYDLGCERYAQGCGLCPQLSSRRAGDASARNWRRKRTWLSAIAGERIRLVTPSGWLADCAGRSPLTRHLTVEVIPNGVPTDVFRPHDKAALREMMGIGQAEVVVMCVANDLAVTRKGASDFIAAVDALREELDPLVLPLGRGFETDTRFRQFRLNDRIEDPRLLSMFYSVADVLVLPSLQDNFPNVILEAMACGLPVVAYAAGGTPEMIDDGKTGALVPVGDVHALKEAIVALMADRERHATMSQAARARAVADFDINRQVESCQKLYAELLAGRSGQETLN